MSQDEQSVKKETNQDSPAEPTEVADEQSDSEAETEAEEEESEIIEVTREELEELQEETEEFRDKYYRRTADLDNLRKRFEREKEEFKKYANYDLLRDLLEVLDNFERARESMDFESSETREGVQMIETQLRDLLEDYEVEPVDAEGEFFDPEKHEGMMREEREDFDRQTVLEVFKKGYKLHDRILRPASVKVGVPVDASSESEDDTQNS